jgi:1-acyl-sn-glycerol-3-phosphate acyltransferase
MVVGALAAAAMLGRGLSIPHLFGVAALCNAAVAVFIYGLVPEFLVRFLVWLLIHTAYRVRPRGLDAIPHDGPALLACDRADAVDALLLMAACRRPLRFVLSRELARGPLLRFVFGQSRAIWHDGAVPPAPTFTEIGAALADGDVVVLLAPHDVDRIGAAIPRLSVTLGPRGGLFAPVELAVAAPPQQA